jgi:DNA-binding response OmpR family regulator
VPLTNADTPDKQAAAGGKFILFGEDDRDDEEFLKEIFTSVDPSFKLLFINAGLKLVHTLEKMEDHQLPCLIVLDYNMPELNGAEILKALKQNARYEKIPKLIWSTSGSETFRKLCLECGADDYFIKPSNVNQLTNLVQRMLTFC